MPATLSRPLDCAGTCPRHRLGGSSAGTETTRGEKGQYLPVLQFGRGIIQVGLNKITQLALLMKHLRKGNRNFLRHRNTYQQLQTSSWAPCNDAPYNLVFLLGGLILPASTSQVRTRKPCPAGWPGWEHGKTCHSCVSTDSCAKRGTGCQLRVQGQKISLKEHHFEGWEGGTPPGTR